MEAWRKYGIAIALLTMAAWTAYCAFFFLSIATPAIYGAEETTALWRLTIVGGWLAGTLVGGTAIVGLTTNAFGGVPAPTRVLLAAAALVTACVAVIAIYWLGLSALLILFWAPLAAALLLLMVWAAGPAMRRRIGVAAGAWFLGCVAVAGFLFALPPGTLGFHFWTLLGIVTGAAVAWCFWPLLREAAQRLAAYQGEERPR